MQQVIHENFINLFKKMNVPCHVFAKNKDESYVFCNDVMAKDLGLQKTEEIVGKDDKDLVWKNYANGLQEHDQHVISLGDNFDFIEPVKLVNGQDVNLVSYKYPMTNNKNEICGVFGISFVKVSKINPLTNQQSLCISLSMQGLSAKEIAKIIGSSFRTVEWHINQAKERLGCRNKTQLVYRYLKEIKLFSE